jgi:GTPase Era involved in 16S rRNA processing
MQDKKFVLRLSVSLVLGLLAAASVLAQDEPASNMDILRDKIKADKKLLIAENLGLTEAEAPKFWPISDEYQKELEAINQKLASTVQSYAAAYSTSTLTDEKAKALMSEAFAIEEAEVALKKKYMDTLSGVVPAMKAVRYLQMENKIRALIRFDLAANIPLVE